MQEESNCASMREYTICLEDFVLEAIIGILPKERERAQKIKIDAEFLYQAQDFLDYRDLREFIKESFAREFGLLEEAQSYFYREIPLRFPQIKAFWIQITKLEIFEDCTIAIKISYPS